MVTHPKLTFFNSLPKSPSLSPHSLSPVPPILVPLSLSTSAPPIPLSPPSLSTTPFPPGSGRRWHPSHPSLPDPAVAGEEDPGSPLFDVCAPLPTSPRYPQPRAEADLAAPAPLRSGSPPRSAWPRPAPTGPPLRRQRFASVSLDDVDLRFGKPRIQNG
ncbi:lysine-rich arabinogalactan protein 19-like [Miscanthus floridulus]|uniref:lysine-rich arabinogalactan protein 19-like n=1 Tax=Miscanthus floridulus TaxID=154761 RepID=UPI003457A063